MFDFIINSSQNPSMLQNFRRIREAIRNVTNNILTGSETLCSNSFVENFELSRALRIFI